MADENLMTDEELDDVLILIDEEDQEHPFQMIIYPLNPITHFMLPFSAVLERCTAGPIRLCWLVSQLKFMLKARYGQRQRCLPMLTVGQLKFQPQRKETA